MKRALQISAACFALMTALWAQVPGEFERTPKVKATVTYAAEPQSISAGKRTFLELHFRVAPGYHVNSHTPKSELLIPTELTLDPSTGINVGKLDYPAGTAYSFPSQPDEKLDVYTGDFNVRLPVETTPGQHTLSGVLRYQACDHAACYPPKSLPVDVPFTAK